MKDIPMFITSYGAASLTLKQIPYDGRAYISIQDTKEPEQLIDACCDFCRAVGAKEIYACGNDYLKKYKAHTAVIQMQCMKNQLPDTDAVLRPVQENTLQRFREIYNEKMGSVPNASYMTVRDSEKMLVDGTGYFIYREEMLLGIGIAGGAKIFAVAAIVQGCGTDVLLALTRVLTENYIEVDVAAENAPAVRLYERLGFRTVTVLSQWYKII